MRPSKHLVVSTLAVLLLCSGTTAWGNKAKATPDTQVADVPDTPDAEWDSIPEKHTAPQPKDETSEPPPRSQQPQGKKPFSYRTIAIMSFVYVTISNWFAAWMYNRRAKKWADHFSAYFRAEFELAGKDTEDLLDSSSLPLRKEAPHLFLYHATGRKGCQSMLITLDLNARDLTSYFFRFLFFWNVWATPRQDLVFVEVIMNEKELEEMVFLAAETTEMDELVRQNDDVKQYITDEPKNAKAKPGSGIGLPTTFSYYSEGGDVTAGGILTSAVKKIISESQEYFSMIHVTDQNTVMVAGAKTTPTHVIRLKYVLPPTDKMEEFRPLMQLPVMLIDNLSTFKLPAVNKEKAVKLREARAKAAEHKQRMQRAQEMKYEKHIEDKSKYDDLSTAQKLKIAAKEDKDRKKAMQKMSTKIKKV